MNAADATVPSAVARPRPAIAVGRRCDRRRACAQAAGSSTSAPARRAASPRSTPPSAKRPSPPPPGTVVALVAGGETAPPLVQAAAEDDRDAGAADVEALDIGAADAVVGVSASGSTPYVLGALAAAERTRAPSPRASCRAPQSELGGLVAHEIAVVVGPGVPRGIDPAQGRHGAEARAQHDLDDLDDPAREDVREPHGRRRRGEREAPGSSPADRGRCDVAPPRRRSTMRSPTPTGMRASAIVMLLARRRCAGGKTAPGRFRREASPTRSRRRREARCRSRTRRRQHSSRATSRSLGGRVAGFGLASPNGRGIAVPGFVDLQVNGFGGVDFLTADTDGISAGGRGAARDRRHRLPTDLHHYSRAAAPRRPPRGAC